MHHDRFPDSRSTLRLIICLAVLLTYGIHAARGEPSGFARPEYPTGMWYSSGDALFEYHWMPMASEATVNAAFDIIQKRYNVERILWRDANVQWVEKWNRFWPFAYLGEANKDWIRFCTEFNVAGHAEKAARARGIQFWGICSLYDYGGKAVTRAAEGQGPWQSYDPWLHANPQYCVYDRAGITYNTSMIEYGYPEVRKEYTRRVEEMFNGPWKGYDGMFMYSYIEHSSVRYTHEYIYTGIACEEYKRRYGADPRTEPFDLDKYYAIRGEYITQYLRDLRPIFRKHNKKLAVALNAKNMEWPQEWLAGRSQVLQHGLIRMDWRTWVKEGLVDELNVWMGVSKEQQHEDVKELLAAAEGTGVKVTLFSLSELPESMQYLYERGVRRLTVADHRNEEGYAEARLASDADSEDPLAVLSVLRQVRVGELDLPPSKLGALLKHANPMVRRQAANAIGVRRIQELLPALEDAARTEADCAVATMMVDAFGEVNGPRTLEAIEQAFRNHPLWPMRRAVIVAVGNMGKARRGDIRKAFERSTHEYFREVLLESIYDTERPDKSAFYPTVAEFRAMLKRGAIDPSSRVRYRAAASLTVYPDMETAAVLLRLLDDPEHAVQSRTARSVKCMLENGIFISADMRQQLFEKLATRFSECGPSSTRSDAEYGWRLFGEALRDGFGADGKNLLIDILNGPNRDLGKLAWQVLFLHEDYRWPPVSREKMEANYRYYPGHPQHVRCPHEVID